MAAWNEWTPPMSVEDKLAIQEVIARYSYAYDGKDSDAFAQLFVEDGVFEVIVPGKSSPAVRLSSRAAIREWAAQRHGVSCSNRAEAAVTRRLERQVARR
jgi:uncharacterized protein (TIGR02246 family)